MRGRRTRRRSWKEWREPSPPRRLPKSAARLRHLPLMITTTAMPGASATGTGTKRQDSAEHPRRRGVKALGVGPAGNCFHRGNGSRSRSASATRRSHAPGVAAELLATNGIVGSIARQQWAVGVLAASDGRAFVGVPGCRCWIWPFYVSAALANSSSLFKEDDP